MASWDDGDYYAVSFSIHKSRRYNAKMRAFYQTCHDLCVAATAITGSAAFFVLFGAATSDLVKWLTAVVAIASTMNLVFGFSRKAERHDVLCRRFTDLAAKLERWDESPENLRLARAERLEIEKDEPTERRLIDLVAMNEECRARGVSPDDLVPLSRSQRIFGYVFTFGMPRIEEWWASREKMKNAEKTNK